MDKQKDRHRDVRTEELPPSFLTKGHRKLKIYFHWFLLIDIQTDRQVYRQTNVQTDRQTDRQKTDRQTDQRKEWRDGWMDG